MIHHHVRIPIIKKLKKRQQVQVANLQDMLMEVIYSIVDTPVLHGGTAVWRCYGGNRFSEDLDFYFKPSAGFEQVLQYALSSFGMKLLKYKDTGNVMFSKIGDGETEVRLETNHVLIKDGTIGDFEKTDGSFMTVHTLPVETLIKEKMAAYRDRKAIRDIYDVYYLSSHPDIDIAAVRLEAEAFLTDIPPAIDPDVLKVLVFSGAVPTFDSMVRSIKTRLLP